MWILSIRPEMVDVGYSEWVLYTEVLMYCSLSIHTYVHTYIRKGRVLWVCRAPIRCMYSTYIHR